MGASLRCPGGKKRGPLSSKGFQTGFMGDMDTELAPEDAGGAGTGAFVRAHLAHACKGMWRATQEL